MTFSRSCADDPLLSSGRGLWKICLCYLDDIIIYARTPQELLQRLRQVLDRLREVGLKVKPSKCALFQQVQFLGNQVSWHGIEPLPDKIQSIKEWPIPHCIRDVRGFFGLASYYRKFVRNFASIAEPLTWLTQKKVPSSNGRMKPRKLLSL